MARDLKVGDKTPKFRLLGADGALITETTLGGQSTLLIFYPGDDTPTCTNEMKDFSNHSEDFGKLNVRLLGVSRNSPVSHRKFRAKHRLQVELATDETGEAVKAFGAWGEKLLFGRLTLGIRRSTVLVDKGRVAAIWRVGRVAGHAAEVLAHLAALARN